MKIYLASDHAGFELKAKIIEKLKSRLKMEDVGTNSTESCDYPIFAEKLCRKVIENSQNLGLLICGTGVGMSMAANKIPGIRAAAVSEPKSGQMAREHNKAQVLCLGARIIDFDRAIQCLEAFLAAKFDSVNPRHQRRIDQIVELENKK